MNEYIKALKNWNNFDGRSRRRDFWMFILFNVIFFIVAEILDAILGTICVFTGIYGLAQIVPYIAVAIRRMHDIGKSGWWICINFVPLIGGLWFLYLAIQDSQAGVNEYGENPKGVM